MHTFQWQKHVNIDFKGDSLFKFLVFYHLHGVLEILKNEEF